MNLSDTGTGAGFLTRRWRPVAITLTVVAVVSATAGWAVSTDAAARGEAPSSPGLATPVGTPARTSARTSVAKWESRPERLEIPAIGVAAPVVLLGLNKDETVEVPRDPGDVGWYRLGPAPGEPGSAVILGHVDSKAGAAVFYRLKSLTPGARVNVLRRDGSVASFDVVKIATYPNALFPARTVYRNHGRRSLTLVTCGGAYDRSRGGYQANIVVYAELVDTVRVRN